uniref:Uncharacterized protein n=1 Tax=Anguilla anguilla TaxID=7936 RepID=A0A0E9UG63_ANGAN
MPTVILAACHSFP